MAVKAYFTMSEIDCRCGCGFRGVQSLFLHKMNELRHRSGFPIYPTSWCRCEKHNRKVGGSKTSSHLKGWACDILIVSELGKYRIFYFAGKIGFRGIGIAKNFIHIDADPEKPAGRIWVY